jgi:RimJ/RimL family protein N-acetyltransferase
MDLKTKLLLKDIPNEFTCNRAIIRRYMKGDGNALFALAERNSNREHLAGTADEMTNMKTLEEGEVKARKHRAEWGKRDRFVAGIWVKDKIIGELWIEPSDWNVPSFEIGWFIDKGYQGQGYAFEAAKAGLGFIFRELEAHRVIAQTDDTNTRSYKLAERLGFTKEGHLRESQIKDGRYVGRLIYGLLRNEFLD